MITFVQMDVADIPQVAVIDRLSFPIPWPSDAYRKEILGNKHAHFFVALNGEPQRWGRWFGLKAQRNVIGFAGYWFIIDEAHISTIAVHPHWRGKGVGEILLRGMIEHALELNAVEATLEVRAGNKIAQNLYRKFGFEEVGQRKNYYRDNGEDALLMTAKPLRVF